MAAAAAGFGQGQRSAALNEIKAVSRTSLKPLRSLPTTCRQCPAGCGIIAYLDGEKLVQILGNPNHPHNLGGICAKGIAGINLANDPERLLYPLKRTGARGAGQWTTITWDEAYSTLEARIKGMIKKRKIKELVIDKGQDDLLLDRFIALLGPASIIDRPALKNLNRDNALTSMTGTSLLREDVARSRFILNFGANPYASHDQFVGFSRRLILAQVEKGAKLFTFDVRMSETAAKSDAWYPLRPGTDAVVALAMARTILDKGLADRNFIDQKINIPLSMIKNHLLPYTLEFAERESGTKAADIEKLAKEFATRKPSIAIAGGGISDHENGTQNVRCVSLLNWLVGNLDQEGGLFFSPPGRNLWPEEAYSPHFPSKLSPALRGIIDLHEAGAAVDAYFAFLSNPAYDSPDCKSAARLLKDEKIVPLLVVMDTHLTETAAVADMVLPAATYLEGWGISRAPSLEITPILNFRQPVLSLLSDAQVLRSPSFNVAKLLEPSFQPRGESKEVGNFCLELARRIGGEVSKGLPFTDTLDFTSRIISSLPALKTEGGLKALKEQGFWLEKIPEEEKRSPALLQRAGAYSETLKQNGQPSLPEYQPIASHKKKKEGEFILTAFKTSLGAGGTANSKWAQEISHENRLWLNRDVAENLGIKNGDKVRVISSAGYLITRALVTSRIHPESVALAEGSGHSAVGNVARALPFESTDRDTKLIWWGKKGSGVNPNEIIESKADPIGGGLALKDTLVRIEKI